MWPCHETNHERPYQIRATAPYAIAEPTIKSTKKIAIHCSESIRHCCLHVDIAFSFLWHIANIIHLIFLLLVQSD
jgi:hypothetical protein